MSEHEDVSQLVDNDELGPRFQNLNGTLQVRHDAVDNMDHGVTSLEGINPALQVDENEFHNHSESHINNSQSRSNTHDPDLDNGVNECSKVTTSTNGATPTATSGCSSTTCGNARASCTSCTSPPVYYSSRTGESTVVHEPIIVTRPDGTRVIQTQQCCHLAPRRYRRERPLRMRHIKLLQAFSIVSIFIFFPLGIPAAYFAYKTEKEFNEGTTVRGNIDMARKLAKRTETLLVFSVMAALLVAVAVFAVVERHLMRDDDDYWKDSNNNRILPAG